MSDDDIHQLLSKHFKTWSSDYFRFARAIEAKVNEEQSSINTPGNRCAHEVIKHEIVPRLERLEGLIRWRA